MSLDLIRANIIAKSGSGRLLENASETQDEMMLILHNSPGGAMTEVSQEIQTAGGGKAIKSFQLLLTHLQVQARLKAAGR